jgi:hypothetical protein
MVFSKLQYSFVGDFKVLYRPTKLENHQLVYVKTIKNDLKYLDTIFYFCHFIANYLHTVITIVSALAASTIKLNLQQVSCLLKTQQITFLVL